MSAEIKEPPKAVVQVPSGRPGRKPHYAATVVACNESDCFLQIVHGNKEWHPLKNVILNPNTQEWNRLEMQQKLAAAIEGEGRKDCKKKHKIDLGSYPVPLRAQKDTTNIAALKAENAALKAENAALKAENATLKRPRCSDSDTDSDNSSESKNESPRKKRKTSVTEQMNQGHKNVEVLTDEFKKAGHIDILPYATNIEEHLEVALALTNAGVAEDHDYDPELISKTLAFLGPSGSGKTMLAVALINKFSENPEHYLLVRRVLASELTPGQFYGQTEKYLEKLTEEIKVLTSQQAPQSEDGTERQLVVVLIFDEYASLVGPACESTSDNGTKQGVQATIRIMFDRWKNIPNLVVLATSCTEDFRKMNRQEQRRFKTFDMPEYSPENIRQILISVIQSYKMELSGDNVNLEEISEELFACNAQMCDISSIVADVKQRHNQSSVVLRSKSKIRGKVSQKVNYVQLTDAFKRFKCSGVKKKSKKHTAKKQSSAQKSLLVPR